MAFTVGAEKVRAALIGKTLSHSYSKPIHERLGYPYDLAETEPDGLETLLKSGKYNCFNVTVPYKKEIVRYLDGLSDTARETGAVNVVKAGKRGLFGYNTDVFGFEFLLEREGIDVRGKTVMILGTGGTSRTAEVVLKRRGAKEIIKVGRNSPVNYANCYLVKGVRAIVNTTPVGMYPDVEGCPIDVSRFDGLESVVDVVYNPLNTLLVRKAGELGVKASGGLLMLVAQAVRSAEIFTGEVFGEGTIEKLFKETRNRACGVAFIGMPGSGKTTLGKMTAELLGKKFTDTDAEAEKIAGKTVEEIFASDGEKVFRDLETEAIRAAAQEKNAVISTGGGAVIREDNRMKLKENSVVIRVVRRVENLCASGRPLSSSIENLRKLESQREPIYRDLADFSVNNDGEISAAFEKIKEFLL